MNDYYYEMIVKPNLYYGLFLDLISSMTLEAIEEKNNTIIIRSENSLDNIKQGLYDFTTKLNKIFSKQIICDIILNKKKNIDWIKSYQDSIKSIEIDKFYIYPSWDKPKKDKINILIDPALTFGSGHHETTNTTLRCISKYVTLNDTVLDIGCGSGILSIAASKLGAKVDACDTDPLAIEDTMKNFKLNKTTCNNSWIGSCNKLDRLYDIVIANIVADILILINKDIKRITKKDGIIILSGIMDIYKNKVIDKFNGCEIIEQINKNHWITLVIRNK